MMTAYGDGQACISHSQSVSSSALAHETTTVKQKEAIKTRVCGALRKKYLQQTSSATQQIYMKRASQKQPRFQSFFFLHLLYLNVNYTFLKLDRGKALYQIRHTSQTFVETDQVRIQLKQNQKRFFDIFERQDCEITTDSSIWFCLFFFFFTVSILFYTGSVFINLSITSHARTHTKVRIIKKHDTIQIKFIFHKHTTRARFHGRVDDLAAKYHRRDKKREIEKEKLESD